MNYNYEQMQELVSNLGNSEKDAKYHLRLKLEGRLLQPEILSEILSILAQNKALALLDPNPYIRYLAKYLESKDA